jgi:hypothetical protein
MNLSDGMQSILAGALFDFAAYLTTRSTVIKAGATEPVYDVLEALEKWASERKLQLTDVDANLDWEKSASTLTLADLAGSGEDTRKRISGALQSFAKFVIDTNSTNSTNYGESVLRFASRVRLSVASPQPYWAAHWWM